MTLIELMVSLTIGLFLSWGAIEVYLQSKNNDLPTLVRVVVTDGTRFVMERNLDDALTRLTGTAAVPAPTPALPPTP